MSIGVQPWSNANRSGEGSELSSTARTSELADRNRDGKRGGLRGCCSCHGAAVRGLRSDLLVSRERRKIYGLNPALKAGGLGGNLPAVARLPGPPILIPEP
ncbi:hypothetical protein MTO96_018102 [Rhipicephalus appendiculatus]